MVGLHGDEREGGQRLVHVDRAAVAEGGEDDGERDDDLGGAAVLAALEHARTLLVLGSTQRRFKQRAEARVSLDDARARLARCLGARPDEICFTSGGTEANDLALGAAAGRPVCFQISMASSSSR